MCMGLLLLAGGAGADEREVREPGAVAQLALDQGADGVEPAGRHGLERAALLAGDEVEVAGRGQRVETRAVPDVEVADEADLLERVEVAVDRGEVGGRQPALEAGRDLVSG